MEKTIELIKATRTNFTKLLEGLSVDALNKIPENLNNNIIWNYGHILATQQVLCYQLSGLENKMDTAYIAKYKKGMKPEFTVDHNEIDILKAYSDSTIDELVVDLQNGIFTGFKPYMTSYGIELKNIEEVVKFLAVHEALHLGYAMVIKKII